MYEELKSISVNCLTIPPSSSLLDLDLWLLRQYCAFSAAEKWNWLTQMVLSVSQKTAAQEFGFEHYSGAGAVGVAGTT